MIYQDKYGLYIAIGDKVEFFGQTYTIKSFGIKDIADIAPVEFVEPLHLNMIASEIDVELLVMSGTLSANNKSPMSPPKNAFKW